MDRDSPISMSSFDSIVDMIQEEMNEDVPEEELKQKILSHNREFYRESSREDQKIHLMTRLLTESKIADYIGEEELSAHIEEIANEIREDIQDDND